MDAVVLETFDQPPSVTRVPDPTVDSNSVVVGVAYSSLNNRDRVIAGGEYGSTISLPYVLGSDVAGRVRRVGSDVEGVDVGDRVVRYPVVPCGSCAACRSGDEFCYEYTILDDGLAERVVVDPDRLVAVPDDVSLRTAACLPVAYLTAWRMLGTRGDLREGESILVLGASGGVGVAIVQLAAALGANVIAVTSRDDYRDRLSELGARYVVDRTAESFEERARSATGGQGASMVVDPVGEATLPTSVESVANGGRVLCCGRTTGQFPRLDLKALFHKQIDVRGSSMGSRREFESLREFVSANGIEAPTSHVLPLAEAPRGFELLAEGDSFGKVLVEC